MRSAPAPDLLPIPGMNQGTAVAAGDGGSGGDDGSGGDGNDKEGAGGGQGGDDANGDNREGDPIDVVTGRVFTLPIVDLDLPGPLPLTFERTYSSTASSDQGLGLGWAHTLGWFIEVRRTRVRVWSHDGTWVSFRPLEVGETELGERGWLLRRDAGGYAVDKGDFRWMHFTATFDEGQTFRLTAIADRNDNRIALAYSSTGALAEIVDSAGRLIKIAPTREGRIASLSVKNSDNHGKWITFARYEYDDRGRLIRVTDAEDYSWTYEYDEFHRLARYTNRVGTSFHFRYDERNRGIETWGSRADGRDPSLADDLPTFLADGTTRIKGIIHRKIAYHANGYSEVTDSTETRRYFGNERGRVDKVVTGGAVTSHAYDVNGFEISQTDPAGATWSWRRDDRGRILEIVDPLGHTTTIDHDAQGLPMRVTDAGGGVTLAHRDARGNVTLVENAARQRRLFTYEERGLLTSVTEPSGATTTFAYDAHGNVVRVVQASGAVWSFGYDEFGHRTSVQSPLGATTRYVYSLRNYVVAVHDANGGVVRYAIDGEGRLVQTTTPNGHTTKLTWGGLHKLCGYRDALDRFVRFAYDVEGELVAVYNEGGEVHTFEYDRSGALIGEVSFDGRVSRYRNDAVGRPVHVENGAGEVTRYVYDGLGRILERTLPDGDQDVFEYNARGELVGATNGACSLRYEWDALGQNVSELQTVGGVAHSVARTFDLDGYRVRRRTSAGLDEVVERDAIGARTRTILDGAYRIDHTNDLLGREIARLLPGGGRIESSFDPMGHLVRRVARTSVLGRQVGEGEPEWVGQRRDGITCETAYAYDGDGRLIERNDGAHVTRIEQDAIGRVLAVLPEKTPPELFRYDLTGNLYIATVDASAVYGPGNVLLRKGAVEYEWDGDGRLVTKRDASDSGHPKVWRYTWNGAGLLARFEAPGDATVVYAYDSFGRRLEKRVLQRDGVDWVLASVSRFVWDGDVLAHELRSRASAEGDAIVEEKTYLFDDDSFEPMAQRVGTSWLQLKNDPVGTPEAAIRADGTVEVEVRRSTWGSPEERRQAIPFGFPGQLWDEDLGWYYNRWRYYDPDAGRFTQRDPTGIFSDLNVFSYAPNPLTWIDPTGLGPLLPGEGNVGPYGDLLGPSGDNITPHHMPSNSYMKGIGVPGYDRDKGVCMNMEQPTPGSGGRHRRTASYGRAPDLNVKPRDQLARDIMDARRQYRQDGVYTPAIRGSLQNVIAQNKAAWPSTFAKPPPPP